MNDEVLRRELRRIAIEANHRYEECGKAWTAYRRKPEEPGHDG